MLRFILPILATDNITLNKSSNPHADKHNKTHDDKHTHSNSTVAQIQMSYLFMLLLFSYFGEKVQVKNKRKHYINNRLVISLQACNRV